MNYEEWERSVPDAIKSDSLWALTAYRHAFFLVDISWCDVTKLVKDKRTLSLADQVYRAIGSISANIVEGYSRGTLKDRARFYEYALGSARGSRDWYYKAHHVLCEDVTAHRLQYLTDVIRLLLLMVPNQRGLHVREYNLSYETESVLSLTQVPLP